MFHWGWNLLDHLCRLSNRVLFAVEMSFLPMKPQTPQNKNILHNNFPHRAASIQSRNQSKEVVGWMSGWAQNPEPSPTQPKLHSLWENSKLKQKFSKVATSVTHRGHWSATRIPFASKLDSEEGFARNIHQLLSLGSYKVEIKKNGLSKQEKFISPNREKKLREFGFYRAKKFEI